MFCKRIKKEFPQEAFISTPARVMAILQLCLAFTVLAWQAGYPFMGELFHLKSKLLVYQYVMGTKNSSYAELFDRLPDEKKNEILGDYQTLQSQYGRPLTAKLLNSIERVFFGFSPFKLMWVIFSIILPILLLKKVEGASSAVWLIPLTTLFFIVDNRWYGVSSPSSKESVLFPSEEFIATHYLKHPLSQSVLEQKQQLKEGWELYLIEEWAREAPSLNETEFERQKAKGDFAFNLARLKYLKLEASKEIKSKKIRESYYILALYLFWNLSFALVVRSAMQQQIDKDACKIPH
jgi:hypothetical protein